MLLEVGDGVVMCQAHPSVSTVLGPFHTTLVSGEEMCSTGRLVADVSAGVVDSFRLLYAWVSLLKGNSSPF